MKLRPTVSVALKEILPDFFFCFASETEPEPLNRSIQRSGIRTPLHVLNENGGLRLCSGFKRFRAGMELGLETVPVHILQQEESREEWFLEVLLEHCSVRSLNLVEKARVLRIVESFLAPGSDEYDTFLILLDLSPHPDGMPDMLKLLELHPDAIAYIEQFNLTLRPAKRFLSFSIEEQVFLAGLAQMLSIRPVELFEIADALKSIGIRKHRTMIELNQEMHLHDVFSDPEMNRNERLIRLKSILYRGQYPLVSGLNERLVGLRKEAAVPESVKLSWDETLESPGFRMNAEIRSRKDFLEFIRWLSIDATQNRLKEMADPDSRT